MDDFFSDFTFGNNQGLDAVLKEASKNKFFKTNMAKEMKDRGLKRISGTNYLINPSKQDLWKIEKDGTIVRCFEEDSVIEG